MTTPVQTRYAGYRFPAEIIGHAVWLYFRFPLGLRMVEELLAARGIIVSHETVRQWARKFGQQFANRIRRRLPRTGDKWHLDEVVLKQQSGKFAPADTPTRAANEAVQIGRPGAAVPFSPRSDQQPVPSPPRSRHCCRAQSFQEPNISGLGRNLQWAGNKF